MQHKGSSLFVISMAVFAGYMPNAFADRCYYNENYRSPQAGEWCEKGFSCPPGCYCTGYAGSDYKREVWDEYSSKNPFKNCGGCISNGLRGNLEKLCKNSFKADDIYHIDMRQLLESYIDYVWPQSERYDHYNKTNNEKNYKNYERIANSLGIFACPSNYPYSDKGAKKKTDCYKKNGSTKEYYKPLQQKCEKGKFPGGLTANCVACNETNTSKLSGGKLFKDRFPGYICPGGEHDRNSDPKNWLEKCSSGKVPNDDFTKCISPTIKCEAGKYLPMGKSTCEPCKTDNTRYYCPGGSFNFNIIHPDYGLKTCPSNKIPNSNRSGCVSEISNTSSSKTKELRQCKPGMYLPAGASECRECSGDRYYCNGGSFAIASYDQGLRSCPSNKVANKKHTGCMVEETTSESQCLSSNVIPCIKNAAKAEGFTENTEAYDAFVANNIAYKCGDSFRKCYSDGWDVSPALEIMGIDGGLVGAKIACAPGKYLPANEVKCKLCDGVNKYCPGGTFDNDRADFDRGINSCPFGSSVNIKKSGCSIKLTKETMYYGPLGKRLNFSEQCWTMKNIEDYTNCMFTIKE